MAFFKDFPTPLTTPIRVQLINEVYNFTSALFSCIHIISYCWIYLTNSPISFMVTSPGLIHPYHSWSLHQVLFTHILHGHFTRSYSPISFMVTSPGLIHPYPSWSLHQLLFTHILHGHFTSSYSPISFMVTSPAPIHPYPSWSLHQVMVK